LKKKKCRNTIWNCRKCPISHFCCNSCKV